MTSFCIKLFIWRSKVPPPAVPGVYRAGTAGHVALAFGFQGASKRTIGVATLFQGDPLPVDHAERGVGHGPGTTAGRGVAVPGSDGRVRRGRPRTVTDPSVAVGAPGGTRGAGHVGRVWSCWSAGRTPPVSNDGVAELRSRSEVLPLASGRDGPARRVSSVPNAAVVPEPRPVSTVA